MNLHMNNPLRTISAILCIATAATLVTAQPAPAPAEQPAAQPAPQAGSEQSAAPINPEAPAPAAADLPVTVTITELVDPVEFRNSPDEPWKPVTRESPLQIGSELRTGPHARIVLQVGPNSIVTLKGLSVMVIADVQVDPNDSVIRTRLAKKYGRLNAKVQHVGDLRNDYQIATPGSTLAIRGSEVEHHGYDSWRVYGVDGSITLVTFEGSFPITKADEGDKNINNPTDFADENTRYGTTTTPAGESDPEITNNDPPQEYYNGPGTGASGTTFTQERQSSDNSGGNVVIDDNSGGNNGGGGGGPIDSGSD
jgi:hypothetical protein